MSLFDGAYGDDATLVADADGKSVTRDRLRNETGGLLSRSLLADQPLIAYLDAGEQPHHILFNRTKGVERDGRSRQDADGRGSRSLLVVTDKRVLLFGSDDDGDRVEAIPHVLLEGVSLQTVHASHEISLETPVATYTFVVGHPSANAGELQSAVSFLRQHVVRNRTPTSDASIVAARDSLSSRDVGDLWRGGVEARRGALNALETDGLETDAGDTDADR